MQLLKGVGVLALGVAWLVVGHGTAVAQTKEARGQVVIVSDASLTVKVGEQTLSFVIDRETFLEARGVGTRSRRAAADGKDNAGIKVTDYVKAGNAVLVSYTVIDGKNRALVVRPIPSAGDAQVESAKNIQGKVKAITGKTLTVEQSGRDLTFVIDRDTDVIARGGTRATRKGGGSVPITQLVHAGDIVRVDYRDVDGSLRAFEIQVRAPGIIPAK